MSLKSRILAWLGIPDELEWLQRVVKIHTSQINGLLEDKLSLQAMLIEHDSMNEQRLALVLDAGMQASYKIAAACAVKGDNELKDYIESVLKDLYEVKQ
jgi:hypothetical protein